MRWPGLPPEPLRAVQRMLPAMAREAVGEVVLHQFTARELALADTMGFEPEQLTVVDDGLVVSFGPKASALTAGTRAVRAAGRNAVQAISYRNSDAWRQTERGDALTLADRFSPPKRTP